MLIIIPETNGTRVKRHPFTWIGYCDRFAETKGSELTDSHDHRLFVSDLRPHLIMVERLSDGFLRYKVRGQWYSSLESARSIA